MFSSTDSSKGDTMDISSEMPVSRTTCPTNSENLCTSKSSFFAGSDSSNISAKQNDRNINLINPLQISGKPSFSFFGKSPSFSFAGTAAKAAENPCSSQDMVLKTPTIFPQTSKSDITSVTVKSLNTSGILANPTCAFPEKSTSLPFPSSTVKDITSKKYLGEHFFSSEFEQKMIAKENLFPFEIVQNKDLGNEQNVEKCFTSLRRYQASNEKAKSFSETMMKKEPIPNIQEASFGSCKDYLEKKKQFSFTDALEGKATAGITSNSCKGTSSVFFPYTSETQKLDKDGSPSAINLSAKTVTNILTGPTKPVHSAVEKGNSFSFVAALGNQVTIADNTFPQPDKKHETKLQSVKADLSKVESSSFPNIKEEEAVLPKHYVSKPTLNASGAKERNDESSSSFASQVPTKSDGIKLYDASKIRKYGDSLARRKVFEDVMSAKKSQKIKRLLSSEEIREKTSIVCKEIQSDINDKEILSNHFSQFGDVQRITCNKEKKYAIVRFKTHEAASMAKLKGSLVLPFSKPVDIFWLRRSSKSVEEKNTSVISEIDQELRSMMEVEVPCILNRPLEKPVINSPLNVTSKQKHNKRDNKPLDSGIIPKISKLPDPSEESLRKFLENTAQTPGEKYRILDARDKLMRLRLLKQSDISTAKAVIGRCPDMCSEKERYSRFEKNRLSVFELKKTFDPKVTVKNLDHMLIIKEYSRSSADQEEPLPHEIRPPQVLMLTMDYIMCNIANMSEDCAVSVGEWYDFIWNRTRAIRKDITQQDLCNVYCVELVEKCARFHIHCAAVLCEEDMATFDPKINDENLTKSLQTLKHLYHDLAIKGTRCPNEAEFRAYDILLSLNEGDALRHAQTLSESIRNSHEVKFAVSAALSLNSNNYVRFFKLVQKAPYLMSCIMHRYFTQVRSKAIKALLKAYCLPNHIEQYPLQDLVSFLKFGDVSEASHFCQWLGFQTDDNYVFLDRGSFAMPASSTLVTRAVTLVECKRNGSVAEVMNNGCLPTNPLKFYKPHASFDDQGNLKKEAVSASDQASKIVLYERAEECVKEHGLQTSKGSDTETAVKHDSQENIVGKCDSNFHKFPPVSVSYQEQKLMDCSTTVETGKCPANIFDASGCKDSSSILCRALSGDFNVPRILPLPSNEMQKISMSQFPMTSDKYVFSSSSLGLDNEEMLHFANEVQQNLLSEVLADSIKEIISKEIFLTKSANKLYDTYLSFALEDELRIICSEVMNCEVMKMAENKKRVYETQKKREKAANDIKHDLINDVIEEIIQSITRSIHEELRAKAINCVSRSVAESFLEDSVHESLTLITKEIYDEEMNAWEHRINTARRKTELLRARKFLVRWERACIARRKLEACRNTFPSNPVFTPIGKLSGSNAFKNFHSIIQSKNRVAKMLDAAVFYNIIKEELSWHPLDLSQVFENCFGKKYPSLPCWKLLLILPVKESDADWTVIASWLCTKFEKGYKMADFDPGTKLCSLYLLPCSTGDPIPICVRAFSIGTDDFSKNLEVILKTGFLEGASAVLLLMPNCEKDFVFQEKAYEHLQQLLAIKSPIPSLPLYCFLTSPKISGDLGNENKLNHIMNEGYIHDYKISHLDISSGFLKAEEELQEAVEWLLCRQLPIPDVSHTYLKDFVEDCLIQVFNIIYHDMAQQQERKKFQNPSIIVQFYNTVVKHWIKTASSAELRNISWPPPEITKGVLNAVDLEFGWNSEGHLNKIKNILSRFILPEFPCMPVTLEELCSYIEEVTKIHFKNTCSLYSSIADILENEQDVNGEKENFYVLWAKIIWECIRYLISCETFLDETTDREFEVNYILEDLQTFDYDDTWKTLTREDKVGSKKRKNPKNSHVDVREHKIFKLHSTPQFCEMSAGRLPASAEIFHFMGSSEKPLFETQSSMTLKETKHFQIEHNIVKPEASSKSMNNFQAEHLSLELSRAIECEKFESEAYFSALAFSVNNGQFQEEEFEIGPKEECSMDTYNAISSSSQCFGTSKLLHKADLQDRIDALNETIEAQHKANKLFDKRILALTFTEF